MIPDQSRNKTAAASPERRRRVKRLKRMIVGTILTMIIVPVLLCVILAFSTCTLQSEVAGLRKQLAEQKKISAEKSETGITAAAGGKKTGAKAGSTKTETGSEKGVSGNEQSVSGNGQTGRGSLQERKVYLTFDDGPSEETDTILDILEQYHVKATFFVVGKAEGRYDTIYKRIVAEGHTLGMHSYSHNYAALYASEDSFTQDLDKLQGFLYDRTGVNSQFYRFPGGSSNTVSRVSMKDLSDVLSSRGIRYFDWNVSAGDSSEGTVSSSTIVNNVINGISGFKECAVVLMHDADDKKTTVEALPEIIQDIQAMDHTEILPITEDTMTIQHRNLTE